ncbi:methyltetrahydrofolate cobalamin methyltransferase [Desulfitobacterium chlororespirans]|uniref:5-methyltetrahydrofolate--homocysteine methyltransferase n=1 Tax=Desulfitobacterium chlororespirans DSM 11544 TaxID=1121395 RepID=A0A1M7UBN6_9FIRM|nr:methyltetrahydrofolate cobalamin methyltransferase [Desulfitobacterium chlororespirans]SHN80346.1 5-methyltetrahydrofolate--homocysteine methyltransferase [Desulfitobacterium chlororespirans DSM 11544]
MIIIGEKINGSIPAMAKAIQARNEAAIADCAVKQAEAGANYLDVCASVPEKIEVDVLKWLIDRVQRATDLPICVDSPSPHSIAAVLPFCQRPGIVNSVSMEGEKIDVLFPLIAGTEWQCIALLCDDKGIPHSVEKRLEVFAKIMKKAQEFKIDPSRLYIDPLVETLSTQETTLTVFGECAREIKKQYPAVHVTSGLSNISFGLPARRLINQAFLVLAMGAGMDSAIIDPTNRDLLGLIYAANALLEKDEYCLDYISAFKEGLIGPLKN